jgi:hypothetical protein
MNNNMTPQERARIGRELVEKFDDNTRKLDLVSADLLVIFQQFEEWNKLDTITLEQAELGKRYFGKVIMNIKEVKKLEAEGNRLREEAIAYATSQADKDKITPAPKIDWGMYLKEYTMMYNDIDEIIKKVKQIDGEGEEWKRS